jgi:hypothetical protein
MKPHSASARQCLVPPSARTWPYDATMQAVSERRSLLSLVWWNQGPPRMPSMVHMLPVGFGVTDLAAVNPCPRRCISARKWRAP